MRGRAWAAAVALLGGAVAPAAAGDEVGYTLTLVPGPPAAVRVTVKVHAEPGTTSRLAVAPSWGGVENCERFVHDLSVEDEAGHVCAVTTDAAAPHGWNVAHEEGATLVATYELRPETPDPLSEFKTHYVPVVRDDFLELIGETGLIYPEWLEDKGAVDLRFGWDGFEGRGWKTVSSFDGEGGGAAAGGGADGLVLHRPLHEFRHAMFMAGKVRVLDREVHGGRVRLAVYGDDWQFEDAELADLVARIVGAEREAVGDFSDPYFLVTVAPVGARSTAQSLSLGGTGLTNCFALFLAPGTAVGPDSPHRNRVLRVLAHEYFHTWNGGKIGMEENPEALVYWFSEGFTDFYASRLLRRAGLIDDAEWAERLNETLRQLWLSPVATEPATTIARDFWKRREVQELPYHRGEVVALMLDEETRRVSEGKKNLDDFFRELLEAAGAGEKLRTDRLLGRVEKWTTPEFAESLRKIVVDGALPSPPKTLADPRATREDAESHRFDAGFDVDATAKTKTVAGVREGSAAFAAGLRDGQTMAGLSIYHDNPDKEITVKVKEGNEVRSIVFWPHGAGVVVPRYRLDSAEGAAAR